MMSERDSFSDDPLYPDIEVQLVGVDTNAFSIMAAVTSAMKDYRRDHPDEIDSKDMDDFRAECMSGNYDHLLQTCMKWVNVT